MMGCPLIAQKKSKKLKEDVVDTYTPTKQSQIQSLTVEALFINAMQAKLLGNYNEAIFRFNNVLKEDPSNAAAYFQLAQLYYSQNQLDKAESHAAKAILYNPNEEWHHLFLAHIKLEKNDLEGGAKIYQQLIQMNPKETEYLFELAMIWEETGKYEKAIEVYEQLEKIIGHDEDLVVKKVTAYQKLNKNKEAFKEIQKLIDQDSTQFRYYGYLGDFYEQSGEIDKAIESYLKILNMDPSNVLAYYSLSDVYKKAQDTTKQKEVLKKAMLSKEVAVEDKIQLIIPAIREQLAEDSSDYNKALINELVNSLIEAHPNDPAVFAFASESYYTFGEKEKAIETLKELVKDTSASKDIHIQYLSILSENEEYELLQQASLKSGQQFPEDPIFDLFNAIASMFTMQYEQSRDAYKNGLKKDFDNPNLKLQMLAGLGDVESQLKNYEKAYEAYEKALEIDPNNATVLNNYAYYLSVQGIELDRAERMSRKSNLLAENNAAFQDTYAWIQYQKGKYTDALIWMEKAMKSAGDKPSADMLDHLGDILLKLNKKEEAIQYWQKSLEIDASQSDILEKIKKNK